MKTGRSVSLVHARISLLSLLTSAWSGVSAANCVDVASSLQAGSVRATSEWREFNTAGQALVRESGTLEGIALAAAYRCDRWHLALQFSELEGNRKYDGQTTTGRSVLSQSAIRQRQGHLQAMFALTDSWSLGGRLVKQTLWRDIASADGASGYPERFDWTLLSAGAQWQSKLGPGQFTLEAWAGKDLQSSMRLTLPGRDQAALKLGAIEQLELAAGWRTQLSPAWHVQADIGYRRVSIEHGVTAVIRRGGIPSGVAYQPRTTLIERLIAIRMGYEF